MARADHWNPSRAADYRSAAVCRKRGQDPWQVDGHYWRGNEPLVPRRYELPRRDQYVDDVRLYRSKWGRLGPLCGTRKVATSDRLDCVGLWTGLDSPTAANEFHQFLLRPHGSVALRKTGYGRSALALGG